MQQPATGDGRARLWQGIALQMPDGAARQLRLKATIE
jgi:hypothetical protein